MRGVYIPNFDQISVKISVLGVLYPYCCTDVGEIWHGGGDRRKTGVPPICHATNHPGLALYNSTQSAQLSLWDQIRANQIIIIRVTDFSGL